MSSSKEIALNYSEDPTSSKGKRMNQINFKYLANNLRKTFKNVPWHLTHKRTKFTKNIF